MPKTVRLRVRDIKNVSDPFHIKNFHKGGWKVRTSKGWVRMVPSNTKIVNPDFDATKPESVENPKFTNIIGE